MATSGRKIPGFKESLSMGSTEDFEICCDPCLSDGHNVEAKGFCLNCQENLCKACLDAHRKTKASKHHQVEDKPRGRTVKSSVPPKQQNVCTEVCTTHGNEVIKFFCRNHEILGCSDCVTLNHRNCHIDYIPDVCTDLTKSKEFKKTLEDVTEKLKQSDDFRNKMTSRLTATRENIVDTIKHLEEFQKNMNEKMNTLKNKMMHDLRSAESLSDNHVHEVVGQIDGISSEMKSIKANLETYQTTGQDAQAFTIMKQAQSRLKTFDIAALNRQVLAEARTYKFEPNEALVDMLSTSDGLGRIVTVVETQPVPSADTLYSLTHDMNIKVKSKSDNSTCDITGCALLSLGKLVVTDWNNNDVKIVDIKKQSVVEEYTLPDCPFDVAVLPHDQVAVTLPGSREIQILKTREKLTTLRNIKVNRWCWGIAYHQDLLYVVCEDPHSVLVLDMQGTVQRDIMLQSALNETFRFPLYITISKNLQQMFISDFESNMVVSLTLQGEVTAVYKNDELKIPCGITVLEDGSLLMCCLENGTIHHISADLTQGRKVAEGIEGAKCICYDSKRKRVYVGSYKCDNIHLLSLKHSNCF